MKDLFISHASEDKDELVRPLAKKLKEAGVDVWYDEFSLRPGESLSASLDRGLIACNYGLVVLSPAFLEKKWTDYELRSLLSKEINQGKKLIPIWHNVDYEMVSRKSLYLADKTPLYASSGTGQLAFAIIREVRPDIINSYALKSIIRQMKAKGKKEKRLASELKMGPILHRTLPPYVVQASKIIDSAFPGFSNHTEIVQNFARDYDYDGEFLLWCVITSAYLDTVYEIGLLPNEESRREMLCSLVGLSMGDSSRLVSAELPEDVKLSLGSAYLNNAELLFSMDKQGEQRHEEQKNKEQI